MSAATPPTNAQSPAPSSPNAQPDSSNQSASALDRIILDYLKNRGHSAAEKALRDELGQSPSDEKGKQRETTSTDELVQSLAVFASKLKSGENALKDSSAVLQELGNIGSPTNLQNLISSIGAVGAEEILSQDPTDQHEGFRELEAWVDGSLDMYRVCDTASPVVLPIQMYLSQPEFRPILFPIFCHFYLDLIQHGFKDAGVPLPVLPDEA